VLVVGVGGEPMGLLVSEIVDIVESLLDIDIAGSTPAVIGSATIRGEAAEVLDLAHYMKAARPGAFERGHAKRFRVMLVDDKLFFRDLLAPIISAAGYEVATIGSAAEGLSVLKRGVAFDIIVTDVDMPEMDGYSFARALAENPRTCNIPVVALDAHAGSSVAEAARNAGMRGVVGKFDRQGLLTTLRSVLEASAFTSSALETRMAQGKAA
jgi:two-component system chemotaxis sensor kinase CheA